MSVATQTSPAAADNAAPEREWRPPSYWPFIVPALVVVLAVIIVICLWLYDRFKRTGWL